MKKFDNDYKYDVRLQERHLRQGLIVKSDLEQYIEDLPDLSEESEVMGMDVDLNIESPEGELAQSEAQSTGPVLVSSDEPEA